MTPQQPSFTRSGALYERVMVPAVFAPWASDLLDAAALVPGMSVLDVACGTGIVARLAALRVGPAGQVAGLDANESMLAIARAQGAADGAAIAWHHADATRLPFAPAQFEAVLCQQGLQYMPDRLAALKEMKRVLAPGGRLAISVFRSSAGHETLRRAVEPYVGAQAAAIVMEPFSFGDGAALSALVAQAELPYARVQAKTLMARFASIDGFIDYQLAGRLAHAAGQLSESARAALVAAARDAFAPMAGPQGVEFPMEAHVVLAGS